MASPNVTLNIDMGRACSRCGKTGATDSGICLACVVKRLKETPTMAKQDPLIPMSDDETRKAGLKLAGLVRELAIMEADHAEIRKEQKLEREKLEQRIADVAASIRDHQGKG